MYKYSMDNELTPAIPGQALLVEGDVMDTRYDNPLNTKDIPYRRIQAAFEIAVKAIQDGQRDEIKHVIIRLLGPIGVQLRSKVEDLKQSREQELLELQESRSAFERIRYRRSPTPREKPIEREAALLQEIINLIKINRVNLIETLRESFLHDDTEEARHMTKLIEETTQLKAIHDELERAFPNVSCTRHEFAMKYLRTPLGLMQTLSLDCEEIIKLQPDLKFKLSEFKKNISIRDEDNEKESIMKQYFAYSEAVTKKIREELKNYLDRKNAEFLSQTSIVEESKSE